MSDRPETVWVPRVSVIEAQYGQLAEHGGLHGIRDEGALDSALARPKNLQAYESADLPRLAAAYAFGIAKNHPFLDGNKRAAFVTAAMFALLNGHELEVSNEEIVTVMLGVADGSHDEATLAKWFAAIMVPVAPNP